MEKMEKNNNGLHKDNFVLMALPINGKQELYHIYQYEFDITKDNKVFVQEINKFKTELDQMPDFIDGKHKYMIIPSGIDITVKDKKICISLAAGNIDKDLRKRLQKTMKQIVEMIKQKFN